MNQTSAPLRAVLQWKTSLGREAEIFWINLRILWKHGKIPLCIFFGPEVPFNVFVVTSSILFGLTMVACTWQLIYFSINGNEDGEDEGDSTASDSYERQNLKFAFQEKRLGIELELCHVSHALEPPQERQRQVTQGGDPCLYRVTNTDSTGQGSKQGVKIGDIIVGINGIVLLPSPAKSGNTRPKKTPDLVRLLQTLPRPIRLYVTRWNVAEAGHSSDASSQNKKSMPPLAESDGDSSIPMIVKGSANETGIRQRKTRRASGLLKAPTSGQSDGTTTPAVAQTALF